MAENPFAQYAPQPNPFAQYATTSEIPTARRSYSLAEVPIEAGKNLPKSAGAFVGGIVQAVLNPLTTIGDILDVGAGALRNSLPKNVVDTIDKVDQVFGADPKAAQRVSDKASAVGGIIKDRYGSYDAIKRTVAEDPVGAAGDLSSLLTGGAGTVKGITTAAGGAARKAGVSTATAGRIANVGDVFAPAAALGEKINPARLVAPVIEAPVKLVGKAAGAVYNALDPKSVAYMTATEGRAPQILNALLDPNLQIVPGSMPTAAQAAAPVGATRFSAMGESSKKTLPTPYFEREAQQKSAQLGQIQSVGQDQTALARAEKLRSDTAENLYGLSDKALVELDSTFNSLLDRPSMSKVISRASELASEQNVPFQIGQNRPAQTVPSRILNAQGGPAAFTTIPAEVAKYPGSSLHMMKMAFDDLIKNPERFGVGASEARAINNTRKEFLAWVEDKVPEYKTARETFAEQSKPINQMQVGQFLEGKLEPALGADTAALRAAGYAEALGNAPATIKRATGQSRFESLRQILTPQQMASLEAVRDDLARARLTEQQARAARGAGPDVNLLGTEAVGQIRAPNLISRVATVANDIMRRLQGKLDQKLAIELATEMLDPAAAAKALKKAMDREAKGKKIAAPFQTAGKMGSKIIRTPAITNALVADRENQNQLAE